MSARTYEESYAVVLQEPVNDVLVLMAAFLTVEGSLTEGLTDTDDFPDGPLKDFLVEVATLGQQHIDD